MIEDKWFTYCEAVYIAMLLVVITCCIGISLAIYCLRRAVILALKLGSYFQFVEMVGKKETEKASCATMCLCFPCAVGQMGSYASIHKV